LGADTLSLEPIAISASKTEQTLKNTTSNIDIITSQELEERHIISVIEALRTLGNIPIAQSGGIGQTSSFFQRGFSSDNTVILIDGLRYNDPTTTKGQAQLEHLMVNDIERIEILNGAQSGIWGANAVAGVINIITKKATEKLQLSGTLEYGTYATTKIGANISQKLGNLSYYVGANQLKSNSFSAQTPRGQNPEDYEADAYQNQTFNAKLGYDISASDTLRGQFTFIDAKVQYDAYNQPSSSANEVHQINRLGSIGYRHSFNADNYLDATYALTSFDKKDPLGYTTAFKGTNKELNVLGKFHYTPYAFVIVGGNILDSKDTIGSHELDSKGVFATNTNRWSNLILTESLRHDRYDTFSDKTTGKIGVKYFLADDITLSSNYGTGYRAPSLAEMYGYGGNGNLQPETTTSFDATVHYKHLSLTYYNNLVDKLIQYVYPAGNQQVEGKSRLKGYEVHYNNSIGELLSIDISYTKLSAKDKDSNYLIRRPQESAMGSLTYYPMSTLSLGTTINYIGTRPDTDYTTYPSTAVQTGRYTLVSAVANYDLNSNITLYLKGDNLTDKRYQEVDGYATAGRSVYAGLNAKF
jgi:vitamin B12 transporter